MKSLMKLCLALAVLLPAAFVSAETVAYRHNTFYDNDISTRCTPSACGGQVACTCPLPSVGQAAVTQRLCLAPTVRLERQVVQETRCVGTGHFSVCFTKPVIERRVVVQRPCIERTVIYSPPVRERVIVVQPPSPRVTVVKVEKPVKPIVRLIQAVARLTDRGDRHSVRDGDTRHDWRMDKGGSDRSHADWGKKSKDRDNDRVQIRLRLRH